MSDLRNKVREAVRDFPWGNYGFDELDDIMCDPAMDICRDLVSHIVSYVRTTDV